MRKGLLMILAAATLALAPMSASAAVRGFVGGGRPYFYGGYYYGRPNTGEVKVDTKVKDAQVFIDGAYAGTTHENKSMYLRPGSYNIEIREAGRTQFTERVYVVAGKTLHLHPEL